MLARTRSWIEDELDAYPIPSGLHWFALGDQKEFGIVGSDGKRNRSDTMAYLVEVDPKTCRNMSVETGIQETDGGRWYAINFTLEDDHGTINSKVNQAIYALKGK